MSFEAEVIDPQKGVIETSAISISTLPQKNGLGGSHHTKTITDVRNTQGFPSHRAASCISLCVFLELWILIGCSNKYDHLCKTALNNIKKLSLQVLHNTFHTNMYFESRRGGLDCAPLPQMYWTCSVFLLRPNL